MRNLPIRVRLQELRLQARKMVKANLCQHWQFPPFQLAQDLLKRRLVNGLVLPRVCNNAHRLRGLPPSFADHATEDQVDDAEDVAVPMDSKRNVCIRHELLAADAPPV